MYKATAIEIDIKKFDKSQDEFSLLVFMTVLKRFGLDQPLVEYWAECHITNKLIFENVGVTAYTQFQRRSGDILTFLGNTIITMCALCTVYDLRDAHGGMFGGDDSLIIHREDYIVPDQTDQIGKIFNLTAKVENFSKSQYFSSRFLIHADDSYHFVPDPLK